MCESSNWFRLPFGPFEFEEKISFNDPLAYVFAWAWAWVGDGNPKSCKCLIHYSLTSHNCTQFIFFVAKKQTENSLEVIAARHNSLQGKLAKWCMQMETLKRKEKFGTLNPVDYRELANDARWMCICAINWCRQALTRWEKWTHARKNSHRTLITINKLKNKTGQSNICSVWAGSCEWRRVSERKMCIQCWIWDSSENIPYFPSFFHFVRGIKCLCLCVCACVRFGATLDFSAI